MATKIQYSNQSPKHRVGFDFQFFAKKVTYRKQDFFEGDLVEVTIDGHKRDAIIAKFIPSKHYSNSQLEFVNVAIPFIQGQTEGMYLSQKVKISQIKLKPNQK